MFVRFSTLEARGRAPGPPGCRLSIIDSRSHRLRGGRALSQPHHQPSAKNAICTPLDRSLGIFRPARKHPHNYLLRDSYTTGSLSNHHGPTARRRQDEARQRCAVWWRQVNTPHHVPRLPCIIAYTPSHLARRWHVVCVRRSASSA